MRSLKKPLLMLLAIVSVVSVTVYATVAFLTDSEEVTNTFTVGKVDIILDEDDNESDDPKDRTDEGNVYNLVPGRTYVKDPTITVLSGSEPCYVRMVVTINFARELNQIALQNFGKYFAPHEYITGWDSTLWPCVNSYEDTVNNQLVYEFRYRDIVDARNADCVLDALFDTFTIPGEVTGEQLSWLHNDNGTPDDPTDDTSFQIVVQGHAIQSEGFEDAAAAWSAFGKQVTDAFIPVEYAYAAAEEASPAGQGAVQP